MNLTLHLVLSDLRRMRVWLIVWIMVLMLPSAAGFMIVLGEPVRATEWTLPDKVVLLPGLQALVGYMLTVILLHEHRLVGTTQYWLTRPISRGRLLRAKAIVVFLMVGLLPVIASLPWWLWCGFTAGQLINAAGETILVMMLIALAAALMAVLTDSFPRALLWTVVLAAVVLFGMASFTVVQAATIRSDLNFPLVISRSIAAVVAAALVMLGVVVAQFYLRRRGWWLAAAAGLAVGLVLLAFQWPRGWIPLDPSEFNASLADSIKLRFDHAVAEPPPRQRKPGAETFQEVRTQFVVTGLPREMAADPIGARQEWRSATGVIRRVAQNQWNTQPPSASPVIADPETDRWLAERAHLRGWGLLPEGEAGLQVKSHIQPSLVARMQAEPPAYQARLWWRLLRSQPLFEVPLAKGPHVAREGRGIRVARVERSTSHLDVTLVETRPVTIRSLLDAAASDHTWFNRREITGATLFQVHRGRSEYLNPFDRDLDDPRLVIVNGVEIAWRRRAPVGQHVIRNGKQQYLEPKVDGDTLAVWHWKEEAIFSREVKVERLQITGGR
jgi:hypothetical protein